MKLSVGFPMLYHPLPHERSFDHDQPFYALVAHVWDENTVSIAIFTESGNPMNGRRVKIGDEPGQASVPQEYVEAMAILSDDGDELAGRIDQVVTDGNTVRKALADAFLVLASGETAADAALSETKAYTDGTVATGPAPLPEQSPTQQDQA